MLSIFEEAQFGEGERRTITVQRRRPGARGRRKAWRKGDVTRKQTQVEPGLAPHPPGISYIDSRAGHPRMRG